MRVDILTPNTHSSLFFFWSLPLPSTSSHDITTTSYKGKQHCCLNNKDGEHCSEREREPKREREMRGGERERASERASEKEDKSGKWVGLGSHRKKDIEAR